MYERFVSLLERDGVTAYKVAIDTGMPASTFSDWKKGKSAPKIEKLYKIAKYFNVPLEYFVDEETEGETHAQQNINTGDHR